MTLGKLEGNGEELGDQAKYEKQLCMDDIEKESDI
ncbi:hypothetical protein ACP4OV_027780 [Aristida adscensionis]